MKKFRDSKNREWEAEVNFATIKRVRDALAINLLELVMPHSDLPERLGDPCLMVDVLYLLCRDQAQAAGVSDEEFGRTMTPDGLEDAWGGILEGLVSFSPRGLRPAHQKILDKATALERAKTAKLASLVESPEFEAMLDRAMQLRPETPGSGSTGDAGNSPALSASSPAGTP